MAALNLQSLAGASCVDARTLTALSTEDIQSHLAALPGWSIEGGEIAKTFKFKNYYETLAFVNALAWIAHRQDHHPDLSVHYNHCRVAFSTHAIGGISRNDFICAAKIETLFTL
jgi:4a-hydroxytetrahydrobiopterin dehydratase